MQHDDAGSDVEADNFEAEFDRLSTPQLEQRPTAPPRDPEECASKTPAATRRRQPPSLSTNQTQVRSPPHTLLACHC